MSYLKPSLVIDRSLRFCPDTRINGQVRWGGSCGRLTTGKGCVYLVLDNNIRNR